MSVLETIRESMLPQVKDHDLRVLEINGEVSPEEMKARLAGFHLWVRGDIVSRFKYAAALGCSDAIVREDWKTEIQYVGDIPDFAVKRIQKARQLSRWLTIHSNQPMPIKRLQRMPDPIVIAWFRYPEITMRSVYTNSVKVTYPDALGFVVAMWDMEKELVLE